MRCYSALLVHHKAKTNVPMCIARQTNDSVPIMSRGSHIASWPKCTNCPRHGVLEMDGRPNLVEVAQEEDARALTLPCRSSLQFVDIFLFWAAIVHSNHQTLPYQSRIISCNPSIFFGSPSKVLTLLMGAHVVIEHKEKCLHLPQFPVPL